MTISAGVISKAELDTEFAANTAALTANALAGAKDWQVDIDVTGLAQGTAAAARQVDWTAPDDCELRVLGVSSFGNGAAGSTVTLALTCIDVLEQAVTDALLGKTVATSHTSAVSATTETTSRQDYSSVSGERHFLLKGLTYRLTLTSTHATALARAFGSMLLRGRRRAS